MRGDHPVRSQPSTETLDGAGALNVSGTISGSTAVPQVGGLYWLQGSSGLFAAGATLGVSATGATVPPFASPAVTGPPGVELTSPTLQAGAQFVFPAGQDVMFVWQGGQPGARFLVNLVSIGGGAAGPEVACSFDAAAGQGNLPAAALAGLGASATSAPLNMHWGQFASTTFLAGRWVVNLTAGSGSATMATFH